VSGATAVRTPVAHGALSRLKRLLIRRNDASVNEVVLGPRKIYMLPTREGYIFAALVLALLVASLNYGLGLGFLICFLLAAVAIVSLLHAQRNLADIAVTIGNAQAVFAGETLRFPVRLTNRMPRARHAISIEYGEKRARARATLLELPAQADRELFLDLPAARRGERPAPAFAVATYYPLGLTRSFTRRIQPAARALVYPRPDDSGASRQFADTRPGAIGGHPEGDDFFGLREFRAGDSPRRVDWKAAARAQALKTKQFGGSETSEIWLDYDALAPLDTEARLSRLAALIVAAERAGQRYGLRLPTEQIAPAQGSAHYHRALTALALFPGTP
jgi:uncharacterized protein (DUF58 family)